MDASRKANREDHEITLQYQSRQEALLVEELNDGKLTELLAFVRQLEQTPPGAAELQRRTKLLGECQAWKAKLQASSMLDSAIGWTGTYRRQNRLSMLRDRLAIDSKLAQAFGFEGRKGLAIP